MKVILVIEDDYIIRELFRELLESEGYIVMTAKNGQEGLEKVGLNPKPSLVLLDMLMPIMGGREFLDTMLKDETLAGIPVLFISASACDANTQGSAGLMKKPVDLESLLERVALFMVRAS